MKDQARACAIELGEWLYWRTAGCSPEVAKMEAIITKHIAIAVREKDSEISELKDHCNLVWQLIKPFLPACPAKSRKLLKKAMEDSKKLRGEGSHRLAEAERRINDVERQRSDLLEKVANLGQANDVVKVQQLSSSLTNSYFKNAELLEQLNEAEAWLERARGMMKIVQSNSLNPAHTMTIQGLEESLDANHKIATQFLTDTGGQ